MMKKILNESILNLFAVLGNIVAVGCGIFAVGEYIARMAVYNLRCGERYWQFLCD